MPGAEKSKSQSPPPGQPCWVVYMVRCADGSLYTGITNDPPRRFRQHQAGKASRYTRARLPVKWVFEEPHENRSEALKREAEIKKLSRVSKLRLLGQSKSSLSSRGVAPRLVCPKPLPLPGARKTKNAKEKE